MVHLYRRSIVRNGKKIKAWYYWYYDVNGKQVRKSCGSRGKPCLTKREAEAFIEALPQEKEVQKLCLKDFCKGMYDDNSYFLLKQKSHGVIYQENTLIARRYYFSLILEEFGDIDVNDITTSDIERFILSFGNYSSSWRNKFILVFDEIFKELYRARKIDNIPLVEKFKPAHKKKKGILLISEIKRLFPDSYEEIAEIWKVYKYNKDYNFCFAALVYTALSTGMRSGEVRGLKYSQFISENAILLDSMINFKEKEVDHLKMGKEDDKRWRIIILPERTVAMINYLKLIKNNDSPYIFSPRGKPFSRTFVCLNFKKALANNGIDADERNLTFHSTRYTYNTIMKTKMDNVDLRLLMGHASESMTKYYDRSEAIDNLPKLLADKDIINSVWK